MLVLYMTVVSCVLLGSSSGFPQKEVCYGSSFQLPFEYRGFFRGKLYFTPSNSRTRKLMMDKGVSKDPRLKVSWNTYLADVTEKDDGIFSVSTGDAEPKDVIRLKILDCARKVTKYYGEKYSYLLPREVEFMEFTPLGSADQPKVLWNRTDPQTNTDGRGQLRRSGYWEMIDLTMADSGYYNLRKTDNSLLSRILLTVQVNNRQYVIEENEKLFIPVPSPVGLWTVSFLPEGEDDHIILITAGSVVREDDRISKPRRFSERVRIVHDGLEIDSVENTDSGTFEFRDTQGNLVQTVQLEVNQASTSSAPSVVFIVSIVATAVGMIICCCCVTRFCLKVGPFKRGQSAPRTAAAPTVYHHNQNQPAGASNYAAPAPLVCSEPTTTSLRPREHNPVNIHANPLQSEVTPLGGQGATGAAPLLSLGSDCLSSNPGPTFELKGLTFPSAPPLSSDSTLCDVYTSDKLNFL